jgi:OOP family OmpA-OmpF porin
MKKLNKVASLFATAALAVSVSGASAQNWVNTQGQPWKNADGTLCWRDAFWTPANATEGCDGAPVKAPPAPPPAPAPAPAVAPVAPVAPVVPVAPPAPVSEKVTFAADAFFDVAKSALKPDAKSKLDDLVAKTKDVNLEVIIAVGHTDSDGSDFGRFNEGDGDVGRAEHPGQGSSRHSSRRSPAANDDLADSGRFVCHWRR